jgi:hypothetical protein
MIVRQCPVHRELWVKLDEFHILNPSLRSINHGNTITRRD